MTEGKRSNTSSVSSTNLAHCTHWGHRRINRIEDLTSSFDHTSIVELKLLTHEEQDGRQLLVHDAGLRFHHLSVSRSLSMETVSLYKNTSSITCTLNFLNFLVEMMI